MYNLGLKLYSSNGFYIPKAVALYAEGVFQYIELYVVPDTLAEHLPAWERLDIPMVLHAPHSQSGLNLSLKDGEAENRRLISQVDTYQRALRPRRVIFHSGINGAVDETIRQLTMFKREFPAVFESAVVENKPRKGLNGEHCIGASPEELERIISETVLGFCLDFGHAICYAATIKEGYMAVIDRFMRLNPAMFHISDGYTVSETDNHLHFGDGDFPIGTLLSKIPFGSWLSIEAQKDERFILEDFRKDARFLTERIADLTGKDGGGLQMRFAQMDDAHLLFDWVTDTTTRAASFNTGELEYAGHEEWLAAKLADPNSRIIVFSICGGAVGQVRLDRREDAIEVDISVAPAERGKGFAAVMLKMARTYAQEVWGECRLTAHIKFENMASQKAFTRAGFANKDIVIFNGWRCVRMEAEIAKRVETGK